MTPASVICRICNQPCHVDKRFWQKLTCADKNCGGKFLIEAPRPLESLCSTAEEAANPPRPRPHELTKCPNCSGPVIVRERLWLKVNCINSLCRTKALIEAPESQRPFHSVNGARPEPTHLSVENSISPPQTGQGLIRSSGVLVLSSQRRFRQWKLAVCAVALVPLLVLVCLMIGTNTGITQPTESAGINAAGGSNLVRGGIDHGAELPADPADAKPNLNGDSNRRERGR